MPAEPTGREHLTPVRITSTSATERAGFRKCRRQWFLTVVHRLDPEEGNVNMFLGTLFHKGLEGYYRALKDGEALEEAELRGMDAYEELYYKLRDDIHKQLGVAWTFAEPMWVEAGNLGMEMLQNYFEEERKNPLLDEVIAVEFRVNVPIKSRKGYRVGWLSVQADVVGRKRGMLRVVDHKSATREASSSMVDQDDQLSAEAFAWWKHSGDFPDEVVYNVALKRTPEPPRLIAKGTKLSKDRSQNTTYELYEQAITDNGFNRSDYVDFLTFLEEREMEGSRFFQREVTIRTPDQLESFERNLREEWRDMKYAAANPDAAYPNPSRFNCPGCPVRSVCMAIEDGQDAEALIKAGYVIGDPRR